MATKTKASGRVKDSYLNLVMEFPLASIKSEVHRKKAQTIIDDLLKKRTLNGGEEMYLDALSDLLAAYEDVHHPIPPASDADMLRHLMDAKGVTQAKLHSQTRIPKSTISEVLAGKKSFSRSMIRSLAEFFRVDVSVLTSNFCGATLRGGAGAESAKPQ